MKKFCGLVALVLLPMVLLTGCRFLTLASQIGDAVELQIPLNATLEYWDTHGGFLGDGETFAKVSFPASSSDEILTQILRNGWYPLEDTQTLFDQMEGSEFKEYLPHLEKGYWYYWDRFSGQKGRDAFLEGDALNSTLAVFDTQGSVLYVYHKDT